MTLYKCDYYNYRVVQKKLHEV